MSNTRHRRYSVNTGPQCAHPYELLAARAAKEGCDRLRDAMLAYYRKHHWGKAA